MSKSAEPRASLSGVSTALTALGFAGGITALAITWMRSDDLRIQPPAWTNQPAPLGSRDSRGASPARVEAPQDNGTLAVASAAREIAEHTKLATALTDTKQTVSFAAHALVDAGIAKEIADGMAGIMEETARSYATLVALDDRSQYRYAHEFIIAIWPDLGNLIREGKLKLDIVAFPEKNWSQPKVPLVANFEADTEQLTYTMSMERWSVSFSFTEKTYPNSEIFANVTAAGRR